MATGVPIPDDTPTTGSSGTSTAMRRGRRRMRTSELNACTPEARGRVRRRNSIVLRDKYRAKFKQLPDES
jgi:hypothetical protein